MNKIKRLTYVFLLFSCTTAPVNHSNKFAFIEDLSNNTSASLRDYQEHRKLPNGVEYGSFVRTIQLRGESADSLKKKLSQAPCQLREDLIREPKNNEAIKDQNGKTSPIWIWTCHDGGVIRIKPQGDPTNRFRPQPHGSKALRYPPTGTTQGFQDETLKLDETGNPLPKWPKDLRSTDPQVIQDWADASHIDLLKK
jgi:hypothetical protein